MHVQTLTPTLCACPNTNPNYCVHVQTLTPTLSACPNINPNPKPKPYIWSWTHPEVTLGKGIRVQSMKLNVRWHHGSRLQALRANCWTVVDATGPAVVSCMQSAYRVVFWPLYGQRQPSGRRESERMDGRRGYLMSASGDQSVAAVWTPWERKDGRS